MMDDKRLDEIRQRIEESREYGKDVDIIALEDAPALIAEVEWMRKELAQCHKLIELADVQLTQYGDVKRKLHELQDFMYPDAYPEEIKRRGGNR